MTAFSSPIYLALPEWQILWLNAILWYVMTQPYILTKQIFFLLQVADVISYPTKSYTVLQKPAEVYEVQRVYLGLHYWSSGWQYFVFFDIASGCGGFTCFYRWFLLFFVLRTGKWLQMGWVLIRNKQSMLFWTGNLHLAEQNIYAISTPAQLGY